MMMMHNYDDYGYNVKSLTTCSHTCVYFSLCLLAVTFSLVSSLVASSQFLLTGTRPAEPSARMGSEGYCSWLCLFVWHLTSGADYVRPENAVTYSAGSKGEKICVGFLWNLSIAEIQHFPHCMAISIVGHFLLCAKTCMCYHHVCMWWNIYSLAEGSMAPWGYAYTRWGFAL